MKLSLAVPLFAGIASISPVQAQDGPLSPQRHTHHHRAPLFPVLIPRAANADPTNEPPAETDATEAKSTTDTVKGPPTGTAREATASQAATADADADADAEAEADDDTEDHEVHTTAAVAPNVLAVAKKAKSSAVANPHPTHKTHLPPAGAAGQPYLSKAHAAIATMQTFYNEPRPGVWTNGWWNSANAYMLLADLRGRDNSAFIRKITDGANGVFAHTVATSNKNKFGGMAYDSWYDDMQWWSIALIKAYDVTGNNMYLNSARETWQVVQNQARNAVCGGLYNAAPGVIGRGQSTIATLLYVQVTAEFATRFPKEKAKFLSMAKTQWKWVMNNVYQYNYIRGDGQFKNPQTGVCSNNGAILSYLEGTAINAAIALKQATGDYSYIDLANTIATKSLQDQGLNRNGILHDTCDMNMGCNPDEAQFKGIFMRSLRNLHDIQPSACGGQIPQFLKQNADSIWNHARGHDNLLGQNWAGPYNGAQAALSLAQHSSATMALVAAALL